MTYSEKMNTIDEIVLLDSNNITHDNFHMATRQEIEDLWENETTDIISTFMPSYAGPDSTYDYSMSYYGVYDEISGLSDHKGAAIYVTPFKTYNPGLDYHVFPDYFTSSAFLIGAWVVENQNAQPPSVPIPDAGWLLGSCLIVLVGFTRKLRTGPC